WAISRDIIEASPVVKIEKAGAETERERALSDAEIKTVWQAAERLPYPFGPFFRLALLTGQRRSEVASMRWADIDEEARTWTIPAELTKPGRAHVVPLSPLAVAILAECPCSGGYVFSTGRHRRRGGNIDRGAAPISGFSKAKAMLDNLMAEIAAAGEGAA